MGGSSRSNRLRKLDGRTREAKRLRAITTDLIGHVGPDRVTMPQRILIERTAVDLLRLELLDAEMAAGTFSDHDGRVAHALRNSVRLALRELKPAAASGPSLNDILRDIVARRRAEPAEDEEDEEAVA